MACLKPSIGTSPSTQTICAGTAAATYNVSDPEGVGAHTFQWYGYTNSNTTIGTALVGVTAGPFAPTTAQLPPADGKVYYYALIASTPNVPNCTDTVWVAVKVNDCTVACLKPSIGTSPSTQTICAGTAAATYNVSDPEGVGAHTFQWYGYTNSNTTIGTALVGVTAGPFAPTTAQLPPADGKVYYYALIASTPNVPNCTDTVWVAVKVNDCTVACLKPDAGPDQSIFWDCGGVNLTTADLIDAKPGQVWRVLKSPVGTNVSVTSPAGIVSGMTTPTGGYQFVLQTIADSLNCRDTMNVIFGACSGCVSEKGDIIALNRIACKGDTFPTLKAIIIGNGTTNWYKTATGGVPIATNTLTYKPVGIVTATDSFFVEIKSRDSNCPIISRRVRIIVVAQNCADTIDLALKKSIDKKIVQIGDVVTYTIKVWNESTKNATGVEVIDQLPAGVQYVSGVASRGSYTNTTGIWTVGNVAANGDTVTLTIKAKILSEGVTFNVAEISKADQKDRDSTPGNGLDGEDDTDRICVSAPVKLCLGQSAEVTVPSNYTGIVWKDAAGSIVPSNGNTIMLTKKGTYTFTAINGQCPAGGCCPVIVEEINCCPAELCVPFTIIKKKK